MVRDSTLEEIVYRDLLDKGITCRHCIHWRKGDATNEEYCAMDRKNFPDLCRDDRFFEMADAVTLDGRRVSESKNQET